MNKPKIVPKVITQNAVPPVPIVNNKANGPLGKRKKPFSFSDLVRREFDTEEEFKNYNNKVQKTAEIVPETGTDILAENFL